MKVLDAANIQLRMTGKSPFSWQSSDVDWCEPNFQYTPYIAEFWNTISNIPFFTLPPLLIYLFGQYRGHVTRAVNVVWLFLVLVGVGSTYFHATLSLAGQLMDEVFILWVFTVALSLWCPKKYMPGFMQQNRAAFHKYAMVTATIATLLGCLLPAVNHMVLIMLGIPSTYILIKEIKCYLSENGEIVEDDAINFVKNTENSPIDLNQTGI